MATKKSKSDRADSKSTRGGSDSKARKSSAGKSRLPSKIFAQVSPRSIRGVSMFEGQNQIRSETVTNFFSDGEVVNAAVARLHEAGFEILQISPMTINIAGTRSDIPASVWNGHRGRRSAGDQRGREERCGAVSGLPGHEFVRTDPDSGNEVRRLHRRESRLKSHATTWRLRCLRRSSLTGICVCPATFRWRVTPIKRTPCRNHRQGNQSGDVR